MLNQAYFEMGDVPAVAGQSWIPLRANHDVDLDAPEDLRSAKRFAGVATLAVYAGKEESAARLNWGDLSLQPHRAFVWNGEYHPADVYLDNRFDGPLGINLVIDQDLEGAADGVWHLHPDLVLALRLSVDLSYSGVRWRVREPLTPGRTEDWCSAVVQNSCSAFQESKVVLDSSDG